MFPISSETLWSLPGYGTQRVRDRRPVHCYTGRRFPPKRLASTSSDGDSPEAAELFEVRIIDNDHNTYEEVIQISMMALAMDRHEAFAVAWEVDHRGHCVVAYAPRPEAEEIADVIRLIGIEVRVNPMGATHA
jgi:hypothetical protein